MNTPVDPYRGMTYTQVAHNNPKYYERPHPLDVRIPAGETVWDASIGRHVTI